MSNMSYCRFQNTLQDLRDCASALGELNENPEENKLSRAEQEAKEELIALCAQVAIEFANDEDIAYDDEDIEAAEKNETH